MEKSNGSIVFYCKDCGQIVDTERCGAKYVYKCKQCGTKNVAFGTKKSIYSFFHIEEEEVAEEGAKVEKAVAEKVPKEADQA